VEIFHRLLLKLGDVQVWAAGTTLLPFLALSAFSTIGTLATILALTAVLSFSTIRTLLALLAVALETTFGLKAVAVAFTLARWTLAGTTLAARALTIHLRSERRIRLRRGGFSCLWHVSRLNGISRSSDGLRHGSFECRLHRRFSGFGLWFWGNGLSGGNGNF
jgi:hypothetical protein